MNLLKYCAGAALIAAAGAANAKFTIDFVQSGGNVVATGSGTIDTTGIAVTQSGGVCARVVSSGGVCVGADVDGISGRYFPAFAAPLSGITNGAVTLGNAGTGDTVSAAATQLFLPSGYVSGTPLSSSSTYIGTTLAAMGLTDGATHAFPLTSGDTFLIRVGSATQLVGPPAVVLPQQGMWSIGSEANGKPGRGIQIDRQGGETLIITYFGYRSDGSATFFQTSGKLINGREFKGNLYEYRNGRYLGGNPQDGEVSHLIGPVAIIFDTATSGTIKLPGDDVQTFSRYQFEDHTARLNHKHEYSSYVGNSGHPTSVVATIRASAGQFSMSEEATGIACTYNGDLRPTGDSFASKGTIACTSSNTSGALPVRYEMVDMKVDEHGMFSARTYFSTSMNVEPLVNQAATARHLQGSCISSGPEFADGSKSRCRPNELNISQFPR